MLPPLRDDVLPPLRDDVLPPPNEPLRVDVELPERYDDELLRVVDVELPERYDDELLRELLLLFVLPTLLLELELFTDVLLPDERVVDVVPPDTRTAPLRDDELLTVPPTVRLPSDLVLLFEFPPWRKLSLRPVEVLIFVTVPVRVLLSRPLAFDDEPVEVVMPVFTFTSLMPYELLTFTPVDVEPPRLGRTVALSTLP